MVSPSEQIGNWLSEAVLHVKKFVAAFTIWTIIDLCLITGQIIPNIAFRNSYTSSGMSIFFCAVVILVTLLTMVWNYIGIAFALKVLKQPEDSQLEYGDQIRLLLTTSQEMLSKFQSIFKMIILTLIYSFAVFIGLICLIVPGVWLEVAFSLSMYIFVEYHEELPSSVVDSLRISMNVVNKQWFSWFLFLITCFFLSLLIIPIPIVLMAIAIAFRESVGLKN